MFKHSKDTQNSKCGCRFWYKYKNVFILLPFLGGAHDDRNKSRPIVITCVRPGGPADRYISFSGVYLYILTFTNRKI